MILEKIGHELLLKLDPEKAHEMGKGSMKKKRFAPGRFVTEDSKVTLFDVQLDNPVGLAAGFDKNGELVGCLREYGFGFMEIGSVTYRGGMGNPKPRLFRLRGQGSLLNRMGLNGDPAEKVVERLSEIDHDFLYGINVAKTHNPTIIGDEAIVDMRNSFRLIDEYGFYHVANLSCPNTEEGKTFEDNPKNLKNLLHALQEFRRKPLLAKLSPTLHGEKLDALIETAEPFVDGYVCGNTLPSPMVPWIFDKYGKGGISGALLKPYAFSLIREVRERTKKPIIAVGGISNGQDAFTALSLGANVVQAYTGFVYGGANFAHKVNGELLQLRQDSLA